MNHDGHIVRPQPAKSSVFETMSCCTVPAPPLPPLPFQPPRPVNPVDLRDWADYGINQVVPFSPPYAHDINIALPVNAEELDTASLDPFLPEPDANGGISVQEAAEVNFTNIQHVTLYVK